MYDVFSLFHDDDSIYTMSYIVSNCRMIDEWWIRRDLEGSRRGLFGVLSQRFACDWETMNTLSKIADVLTEIRTPGLRNKSMEHYL